MRRMSGAAEPRGGSWSIAGGRWYTGNTSYGAVRPSLDQGTLRRRRITGSATLPLGPVEDFVVPKQKSHRGARKRFKLTGSGKVKRRHSMKNHILTKKDSKRKRHLRKGTLVSPAMAKAVKAMIA